MHVHTSTSIFSSMGLFRSRSSAEVEGSSGFSSHGSVTPSSLSGGAAHHPPPPSDTFGPVSATNYFATSSFGRIAPSPVVSNSSGMGVPPGSYQPLPSSSLSSGGQLSRSSSQEEEPTYRSVHCL